MTYTDFSVVSSCPFLVVIFQFRCFKVNNLLIVKKSGGQISKKCPIEDGGVFSKQIINSQKHGTQIVKKSAIKDESAFH